MKTFLQAAIAAAKAGAAVVHCHVRDPDSGTPSRDLRIQSRDDGPGDESAGRQGGDGFVIKSLLHP